MEVFDGWSYDEITTPSIDYYSLFEGGMGRDEAERAFRFTDTDGHLLTLRPEVTSGVARAAATLLAKSERPLRLCYAANVFRQRSSSRAEWRRETTQLGCELIGSAGIGADMEVLALVVEVLERLGLQHCITLNDVEIFNGIVEQLEFDALTCAHLRDLIGTRDPDRLRNFFQQHAPSFAGYELFSRPMQVSDKRAMLAEASRMVTNSRSRAALNSVEWLWSTIESLGLAKSFEIDFGDVPQIDYYTGLTFKIYLAGIGVRVGAGGRYDELTGNFGQPEPAVGFVLDLDSLGEALTRGHNDFTEKLNRNALCVEGLKSTALFSEVRLRRKNDERIRIGSALSVSN
jgi:ATP phosphoribosyltransferase regulatory subunit